MHQSFCAEGKANPLRERNPLASLAGFGHAPIPRPENTSNDKHAVASAQTLVLRKWNANCVARGSAGGTVKNEDRRDSADEEMSTRRRAALAAGAPGFSRNCRGRRVAEFLHCNMQD
jgi:hypothetical protein